MGAIVENFGDVYLSTDSTYASGTLVVTADVAYIVEVIATNLTINDAVIYIYVKRPGETNYTSYSWIAFNLPLPTQNSWTSPRFAITLGDSLYVAGSAGVTFHAQGMDQIP
jgi:hypothetical protein